jgi:hypothetical protein
VIEFRLHLSDAFELHLDVLAALLNRRSQAFEVRLANETVRARQRFRPTRNA